MQYPKSFTSSKYPDFIQDSLALTKNPNPASVFPEFGLNNFTVPLPASVIKKYKLTPIQIKQKLIAILEYLLLVNKTNLSGYYLTNDSLTSLRQAIKTTKNTSLKHFSIIKKDEIKLPFNLRLIFTLKNNHISQFYDEFFKTHKLFIFLSKLLEINILIDNLIKCKEFVELNDGLDASIISRLNKPKIVFSATGPQANWDMATMSMRGISSCQSWDSSYANCLIGSILDPCAAIIYLTDGQITKLGPKMIGRSLVRLVFPIDGLSAPKLMLERAYSLFPTNYDSWSIGSLYTDLFKTVLKKKSKKLDVFNCKPLEYTNGYFLPEGKILNELDNDELSYRDSKILYSSMRDQSTNILIDKSLSKVKDLSSKENILKLIS